MTKESDIDQLFYRCFPDLRWSQRTNIAADVSAIAAGSFDFETFIGGLSDNASDLPALRLPDGRTLATDDAYDDRDELKGEVRQHISEYLKAADAYERKLRGLTRHALQQALSDAKTKDAERKNRVRQKREGNLPFSAPEAQADMSRWARLAPWTPEQAVALSFGKDPDVVDSKQLMLAPASSPFRIEYQRRLEQLHRAIAAGTIKSPLTPAALYAWSRIAGIYLTEELKNISTPDEIVRGNTPKRSAAQAKLDNSVLRILAGLAYKVLDIDLKSGRKHNITDDQADLIEKLIKDSGISSPQSATIKNHIQAAIDLVYAEEANRRNRK